jgi:hypothetical protein
VINALLGERYLKEGVVPTTNEITFLRFNDLEIEKQHCERYPDGQYICYLPAPILREVSRLTFSFLRLFWLSPGYNLCLQLVASQQFSSSF